MLLKFLDYLILDTSRSHEVNCKCVGVLTIKFKYCASRDVFIGFKNYSKAASRIIFEIYKSATRRSVFKIDCFTSLYISRLSHGLSIRQGLNSPIKF